MPKVGTMEKSLGTVEKKVGTVEKIKNSRSFYLQGFQTILAGSPLLTLILPQ